MKISPTTKSHIKNTYPGLKQFYWRSLATGWLASCQNNKGRSFNKNRSRCDGVDLVLNSAMLARSSLIFTSKAQE